MNADRRRSIEEMRHSASQREPGERSAFLAEACRGDEELRREVELLLANSSAPGTATVPLGGILSGPLAAGARLGPYRSAFLGAGGMGDVYRAVDTRLGRDVANKISREQFSARFEHDARAMTKGPFNAMPPGGGHQ